jgi:iron uptake system component EfeO
MVVEERENIAPGFHSLLTAKLRPGAYEITCGLLSNPRGRLVVTPSAASEAERNAPPITAFIGPLSEYKVYLVGQSSALLREVTALAAAIDAGDLAGAKAAWLAARLPYKRIEAVASRIADLENAIDPLPDYLEAREKDPAFTGFHRVEYGLWSLDGAAEGTADPATSSGGIKALSPVAARLLSDVTELKTRLRAMKLAPEDLAGSAARQAERLSTGQISTGEDRWSLADLPAIEASLDGIAKAAGLLLPLVQDASPETAKSYGDRLSAATAALQALKQGAIYPAFSTVDVQARNELAQSFAALATAVSALNPAIGLE